MTTGPRTSNIDVIRDLHEIMGILLPLKSIQFAKSQFLHANYMLIC